MPPRSVDIRRRPELAAGELEYDSWAELLIKSSHNSFGRHDAGVKFGPWVRKPLSPSADADECKPPPPEHRPEISRKQRIEFYRQEMMEVVRDMPVEEMEEAAAFELSFRDIVEAPLAKNQPAAALSAAAARENSEKQRKQKRENRGASGFVLVKALVLAAVGGRRKIAGGGVEKAAKVLPNPCQSKYEERICGSGRSDHGGGGRNRGRGSCYLFLQRDRSKPTH